MRAVSYLMIGSLLAPVSVPTSAAAQDRYGSERYDRDARRAVEACGYAVPREIRDQYPQAYNTRVLASNPQPQGRGEISVRGDGEFQDRNGGAARFAYSCAYDTRADRAYGLDVYDVRPKKDPNNKKDNSAAIAGLVLGAIVVGALVASKDKDKDRDRDSWSPSAGVRCSRSDRSCYEDGRYSRYWTRRIFVDGR